MNWIKLETVTDLPPANKSKCLVTNNIGNTDNNGQMANIWLVPKIHVSNRQFVAFTDTNRMIEGITHYCPYDQEQTAAY